MLKVLLERVTSFVSGNSRWHLCVSLKAKTWAPNGKGLLSSAPSLHNSWRTVVTTPRRSWPGYLRHPGILWGGGPPHTWCWKLSIKLNIPEYLGSRMILLLPVENSEFCANCSTTKQTNNNKTTPQPAYCFYWRVPIQDIVSIRVNIGDNPSTILH